MVGLKRCIVAFFAVYLTLTTLSLHASASKDFCATAMDKPLCEKIVKGATNWNQAMTMAIADAMKEIGKLSKSGNPVCKEAYGNTLDKLKESKETLHSVDKDGSLNFKLSAALTSLEDCKNEAKDLGKDVAAVKKLNHDAEQAIRVCLAVDTSKSAH